jgi:gamma-glutamyltranspeptidase/glutathione hydrolase
MPPPSSGGAVLIEMLNILEGFDLQKMEANSSERYHLMAESMRRALPIVPSTWATAIL